MARREKMPGNVFDTALTRLVELYEEGHRLVVSFSAGKDSTIVLEMCIIAARMAGRLPVEVVLRDEEVMVPGTYEYAERVANRKEVAFHWLVAGQPVVNVFNRAQPYFWVFDPAIPKSDWVREPPSFATPITDLNINAMTIPTRFPPADGKTLFAVLGIRTQESMGRLYGLFSAKGHLTKPNKFGVRSCWPIYDWADTDVWKAIKDFHWDYNSAYDTLRRLGIPNKFLRVAPPTMNAAAIEVLRVSAAGWPRWFDKVSQRLPGVRSATLFGRRVVEPARRYEESWEECYQRECIDTAPSWIAERAIRAREVMLGAHKHHSTAPFPEVKPCYNCHGNLGCWKRMTEALYLGDPFAMKAHCLSYVEPEFFRPGAGKWGGDPSFG